MTTQVIQRARIFFKPALGIAVAVIAKVGRSSGNVIAIGNVVVILQGKCVDVRKQVGTCDEAG